MPVSSEPKCIAQHVRQLAARERRGEVADILRWRADLMEKSEAAATDDAASGPDASKSCA